MSIGPSTSGKRPFCQDREDALRLFPWQKRDESPAGQPGPLAESQCAVFITYSLKTEAFIGSNTVGSQRARHYKTSADAVVD